MNEPNGRNGNGKAHGKAWKDRAIDWAYITAILFLMSFLNKEILVPQMMQQARTIAREEIKMRMDAHEGQVDERMDVLHTRLSQLATKEGLDALSTRLASIEERLRHLERSGK